MKLKISFFLIFVCAIMLFSMQMCDFLFGTNPEVKINSPQNNVTITNTYLTVSGTISDKDDDAYYVTITIGSFFSSKIYTSSNFSKTFNISSLTSGQTYTIVVIGYDKRGAASSQVSVNFTYLPSVTVTPTPPTLTVNSPTNNATITSSTLKISGTVIDSNGDAKNVTAYIQENPNVKATANLTNGVTTQNYTINLDISDLPTGSSYTLVVSATDNANNTSDIIYITFTNSEDRDPELTLEYPHDANGPPTITSSKITVSAVVKDSNCNAEYVKIYLSDYPNAYLTQNLYPYQIQEFSIEFDLSSFNANANYELVVEVWDTTNLNVTTTVMFYYQTGTNILKNGNFNLSYDKYSGTYETQSDIDSYLNKTTGDSLANWKFYIYAGDALDNKIKIDLNGSSIRYYSTADDGDGNAKFLMTQLIYPYHTVTANTKIKIRFKITDSDGNSDESPLKISYNGYFYEYGQVIAIYSIGPLTNPNGTNYVAELTPGETYTYEFYLCDDAGVPIGTQIENIQIWANDHHWDVTIYNIELFEGP